MTVIAAMAIGAHALSLAAPAIAQREDPSPGQGWDAYPRDPENASQSEGTPSIATPAPTATPQAAGGDDDGIPIPALAAGVALAFALGLAAGHAVRRRRAALASVPPEPTPRRPTPPPPPPDPAAPEPDVDRIAAAFGRRSEPFVRPKRERFVPKPEPPPPAPDLEPLVAALEDAPPRALDPQPEPAPATATNHEPVSRAKRKPPTKSRPKPTRTTKPRQRPRPVAKPEPHPQPVAGPEPPPTPTAATEPESVATGEPASTPAAEREPEPTPTVEREPTPFAGAASERPAAAPRRRPVAARQSAEEAAMAARRLARPEPWPEAETEWTCEIGWKAGYRKSVFRAMVAAPGPGRRRSIGESAPILWTFMADPMPPTPELVAAVKALVAALEEAGWERARPAGPWYALRFLWRGQGEPQRIEVQGTESTNAGDDNPRRDPQLDD